MTHQIRVNGITYTSPEVLPAFWAVTTVTYNGYQIAIHVDIDGMPWFDVLTPNPTEAKFVGIEFCEVFDSEKINSNVETTLERLRFKNLITNFTLVQF